VRSASPPRPTQVNETVLEPKAVLRQGRVQLGSIRKGMTLMEFALSLPPSSRSSVAARLP